MVVDQPATIGALTVAVARDMGITVGYLPGLSMRRIANLTPGSTKTDGKDTDGKDTDTKDAAVIAQAHRHILILHAMIRNDILYDPHSSTQPPVAA